MYQLWKVRGEMSGEGYYLMHKWNAQFCAHDGKRSTGDGAPFLHPLGSAVPEGSLFIRAFSAAAFLIY